MESILGEDAGKIVEMTTRDLECYINFIDKTVAGFERTDSNFERSSTMGMRLSNSTVCTEKSFVKGRVHQCSKLHCCLIIRNGHSHPNPQQPPINQ